MSRSDAAPLSDLATFATAAHADVDPLGALMAQAQRGDRAAYASLLRAVTPIIRALARRQRDAVGEVEDVVQDVLLHLHGIRHTYDPARPFKPWLVAIARRRIIDACRRQSRRAGREAPLPDDETFPADATYYTYYTGEAPLDGRALARTVASLPPRQRLAVELLKLRELTLKEAAATSGVSVAALKVAMHRALGALRRVLVPPRDEIET